MCEGPRSLPPTPMQTSPGKFLRMPSAVEAHYEKHKALGIVPGVSEYSGSTVATSASASTESVCSKPSTVSTATGMASLASI